MLGSHRRVSALTALALIAGLAITLWAPKRVLAQPTFPTDEYSSVTFRPAPGTHDYLMVDGARVSGEYTLPPMQLVLDSSVNTLKIPTECQTIADIPCGANGQDAAIVSALSLFHLVGSYTFLERFEVGLSIPIAISGSDGLSFRGSTLSQGTRAGLADWRLSGKVALFDGLLDGHVAVSTLLFLNLPFGQLTTPGGYVGDDHPGGGGHVIGEYTHSERFRAAVNLGGYYRPERQLVTTQTGSMMYYALAAEYLATTPANLWAVEILGELTGSTAFGNDVRRGQMEMRLAGRLGYGPFKGTLGLGFGLIKGPGVPDFRFLLGFAYAQEPQRDADADGIFDGDDACPDAPEDRDGYADEDGCPEADNDGDGIDDGDDPCPNEAEDLDDHEDEDGCPDADNDGDGVDDRWDSCPNTPEDLDGDRDTDGCPENDADQDGVDDALDACPHRAEDTDGLGDEDGCPERDFDMDRIPDHRDECPEDAEDRDGYRDRDGCPEPGGRIHAVPQSDLHEE